MHAEQHEITNTSCISASGLVKRKAVLVDTLINQPAGSLLKKLSQQDIELLRVVNGAEGLTSIIEKSQPDVLILSVDFLDAVTLEQLISVNKKHPLPVVVFARQHAPEVMKTVVDAGVSSYVVDDVQAHRIPVIIDLAVVRFAKIQNLNNELQQTKEKLSERKIIERAKGIIMQQKHLSEEEAYSQMRKSAMNQGQSMGSLAKRIIDVFEMLG